MNNPLKFVIVFYERSGSTLLVDLLNQHPDISCKHEVFHLDWTGAKSFREATAVIKTDDEVLDTFDSIYSKPNVTAAGFKFKYPHQFNTYPLVWEKILSLQNEIRILFLYRLNRLKAAISSQNNKKLVDRYGQSNFRKNQQFELAPLDLDIKKAIRYIKAREKADKFYSELTKKFSHRQVYKYEQLALDPISTVQKMYKYLNVDSNFKPEINFKKISSDSIQNSITNYTELVDAFECTPWEKYLY